MFVLFFMLKLSLVKWAIGHYLFFVIHIFSKEIKLVFCLIP